MENSCTLPLGDFVQSQVLSGNAEIADGNNACAGFLELLTGIFQGEKESDTDSKSQENVQDIKKYMQDMLLASADSSIMEGYLNFQKFFNSTDVVKNKAPNLPDNNSGLLSGMTSDWPFTGKEFLQGSDVNSYKIVIKNFLKDLQGFIYLKMPEEKKGNLGNPETNTLKGEFILDKLPGESEVNLSKAMPEVDYTISEMLGLKLKSIEKKDNLPNATVNFSNTEKEVTFEKEKNTMEINQDNFQKIGAPKNAETYAKDKVLISPNKIDVFLEDKKNILSNETSDHFNKYKRVTLQAETIITENPVEQEAKKELLPSKTISKATDVGDSLQPFSAKTSNFHEQEGKLDNVKPSFVDINNLSQTLKQFINKISPQDKKEIHEFEIQLHPVELGKIKISFRYDEGKVHLSLLADENNTQMSLLQNLPELREKLNNAGVNCASLQINQNFQDSGAKSNKRDRKTQEKFYKKELKVATKDKLFQELSEIHQIVNITV